jgi:hypothetical protein
MNDDLKINEDELPIDKKLELLRISITIGLTGLMNLNEKIDLLIERIKTIENELNIKRDINNSQ